MPLEKLSKEWFKLEDHRRRLFSKAAWVPVFGARTIEKIGDHPAPGYFEEVLAVGAAAIFQECRSRVDDWDWHHWTSDGTAPWIDDHGKFHRAGAVCDNEGEEVGFRFVLHQYLNSLHPRTVLLHQDFVQAYGLVEEGNSWFRPNAGYEEVVRVERDDRAVVRFVEIRGEYLRDFLAARNAALRLYYYRQREAVFDKKPDFVSDYEVMFVTSDKHDRCELRCTKIDETGDIEGASWAIFSAWRTDVDPDAEIPDFGDESDSNTDSASLTGVRDSKIINYLIAGEMWRGEWIEPADCSTRMGYNEAKEPLLVAVDATGARVDIEELRHETVGKYLWFRPELIPELLGRRGGFLNWYTAETGLVSAQPDWGVHFGVNRKGIVNAYAHDIAVRPLWERRIWVANNIQPDGGVSAELLSAQMACKPASSKAPEFLLPNAIDWLNENFRARYQIDLFSEHGELPELARSINRFRALNDAGLRALAKDVVRFTIERISKPALLKAIGEKKSDLGSLKLLERVLASVTNADFAKSHMSPLYGLYDLRRADAHLSQSDLASCYERLKIEEDAPLVIQGETLIEVVANTIGVTGTQLRVPSASK